MTQRRAFVGKVGLLCLMQAPHFASHAASSPIPESLSRNWSGFARSFVTSDGRVIDTGNQQITHSEGLGVALLASLVCNDRPRFNQVFEFARVLKRPDELFSWKWVPGTGIADRNNATDGDIYIAWALLRAGEEWKDAEFTRQAALIVRGMRTRLAVNSPHGKFLLPGVDGFSSRDPSGNSRIVVNPSYWAFPAYRAFQSLDSNPLWNDLEKDGLNLLASARFGRPGLPPDWLSLDDPIVQWKERPARFGYEAIRIPLFLSWSGNHGHPALKAFAQFAAKPGFPAWASLTGNDKADYAAPIGFEAVARLARHSVVGEKFRMTGLDNDYYSSSLALLAGIAASDLGWV